LYIFLLAHTMTTYLPVCDHDSVQISPLVTINEFPDEVLLEIFDFCRATSMEASPVLGWMNPELWSGAWPRTWRKLAQVCQRWRYVLFSLPLRLHLHVYCTRSTPLREMLDVWPPFPIQLASCGLGDNIFAALEHRDRICEIDLRLVIRKTLFLLNVLKV
jgi:F-box-like